ncbi:serine protease gd-like [Eupeodes corollae]|uniref:serine protease gd-like n=1 Tax=Eupeodes corollae TaxID=290404 RepID=UPI00248F7855|nr:serine protease gd-like [Eupeodes corollae]
MVLYSLNFAATVIFVIIVCIYGENAVAVELSSYLDNSEVLNPVKRSTGTKTLENSNTICGQENEKTTGWSRFPWIVAILMKDVGDLKYLCLGNLISSKTVIAAAHCVGNIESKEIVISMNWNNLKDWSDATNIDVEKIILHPEFMIEQSSVADLAVLHLKQSIPPKDSVNPICMWQGPTDVDKIKDVSGAVISWGPNGKGSIKSIPKLINVTVLSESTCIRSNNLVSLLLSNTTLCAKPEEDSDGMCIGDSGAGLMIKKGTTWMLRAIVISIVGSPNDDGCYPNKNAIFTDTVSLDKWIRLNTL